MSIDYPPGISQAVADTRYVLLGPGTPGQTLSGGILTFGAGKTWVFKDQAGNALLTFGDLSGTAFVVPAAQGFTITDSAGNKLMQLVDAGGAVSVGTVIGVKGGGAVTIKPPAGQSVTTTNNILDDGSGNGTVNGTLTAGTTATTGQWKMGSYDANTAGMMNANLGSLSLTTSFAILQDKNGITYINAAAGQAVKFKIANTGGVGVIEYTSTLISLNQPIAAAKTVTTYNGIATAGIGILPVFGGTLQKAEAGDDASLLSYTPPAVAGQYLVMVSASDSAFTSNEVVSVTWTDANGSSRTVTLFTITAVGVYSGVQVIDINNAAAAIVVKLTGAGSITAKVSASVIQLQ